MSEKFKMSKLGHKLIRGGMIKELLMTIFATTISIVLTFGTARFIEQRQAEQAQRQTAMMLIHDIDRSVAVLDYFAEREEKRKAAIQYVIDHFDQIESLPEDTLYTAISMMGIIFTDGKYFDDSKEKIFNSSQDTWTNLDDVRFVDNMESFYEDRHYVETMLTQSPQWEYPMSQEEYYDMKAQINSSEQPPQTVYAAVLKEKLRDPKIRYYIDCSADRAITLRQYAQSWTDFSDRNKFIMNIDDEELAEYIKKSQRSGRTVSKSDIIGHWECEMSGKDLQYYDFMKPDSYSIKIVNHYAAAFYSGDIIVKYKYGGKWNIEGDSLMLNYSSESVKVEVDQSGITYRAEMRDSVESYINNYFQEKALTESLRKQCESLGTTTYGMSINKSGDKIEWVYGRREDESIDCFYLRRIKD